MVDNKQSERYQYIDALRGIASIMVLLFHSVQQARFLHPAAWIQHLTSPGARGVQLFYVLSAFTLFLTLASRAKRGDTSKVGFFIRRYFRIAPLYYVAVVFYLWQYGRGPRFALGDVSHISLANIFSNFVFINGFHPYWINSIVPVGWSVTVEMAFYCCVPFLFLRITNIKRALLLTVASLGSSMIAYRLLTAHPLLKHQGVWHEFLFQWIVNQMPIFCLGFVLYFMITNSTMPWNKNVTERIRLSFGWGFFALGSAIGTLSYYHRVLALPEHFAYGIAFVFLTQALALCSPRLLVNRLSCYLGTISYSIYLTHVVAMHLSFKLVQFLGGNFAILSNRNVGLGITLTLVFAITIALATVTYRIIEVPGQKLGVLALKQWVKMRASAQLKVAAPQVS